MQIKYKVDEVHQELIVYVKGNSAATNYMIRFTEKFLLEAFCLISRVSNSEKY